MLPCFSKPVRRRHYTVPSAVTSFIWLLTNQEILPQVTLLHSDVWLNGIIPTAPLLSFDTRIINLYTPPFSYPLNPAVRSPAKTRPQHCNLGLWRMRFWCEWNVKWGVGDCGGFQWRERGGGCVAVEVRSGAFS
jgi:hypothetical protein